MTEIQMPRGWKAIEVPPAIDVLPKDKKGFPIPYVAEWSHSDGDISLDKRENYAYLLCDCKIGEGTPVLGHQCPRRQRECMSKRKCQVCAQPIPENEPVYFIGGLTITVFWEPPLHESCARYSLQVCPGITRRDGVFVTETTGYNLMDRFEYSEDESEFVKSGTVPLLVQIGLRRGIITYHGAQIHGGEKIPAKEFLG